MVCSSPALRAQGQPSSDEAERRAGQPDLLWLAGLTGAHLGLAPISQDPEDRCSIWENLVSLVDFQCPGFPLTSEELRHYIDIPRVPSPSSSAAVTLPLPRAVVWPPPPLPGDIDYKSNAQAKPPYSYATLICMAMEASEKPKLSLAAICKWIRDNFCYFRRAHPSWQSSVRHNLCINKRFVKVPREKGEPGRGAFWKLHPQYAEWLRSSTSERHRELPEPIPAAQPGGTGHHHLSTSRLELGAELQRLLREFEEFESSQNPAGQRYRPAEPAQGSLEGLSEMKGSAEWGDAVLGFSPERGDCCALGQLGAPGQAGGFLLLQPGWAQGQPRGELQQQEQHQEQEQDQYQHQEQHQDQEQDQDQDQDQHLQHQQQQQHQDQHQYQHQYQHQDQDRHQQHQHQDQYQHQYQHQDQDRHQQHQHQDQYQHQDQQHQPQYHHQDQQQHQYQHQYQHQDQHQQQQHQILLELGPTKASLDETLLATAFLEAAWGEESRENLPGCVPEEQGAGNSPGALPGGDALGWDSLVPLNLY